MQLYRCDKCNRDFDKLADEQVYGMRQAPDNQTSMKMLWAVGHALDLCCGCRGSLLILLDDFFGIQQKDERSYE